ncbi:aminotransferase class III-fold pyridoxal phosphate-dependent enzyme [Pedobacter sp. MR2016-19]|uniref:aminotransferase class III-fold pyridoxal phosphate-dependent enzyme n=1 Tax=Pedobacter sp. MR2016-19 TaxID=2780089 RepID=UPI0018738302|nr:aminotransferase class III-fold pyridoxal phosphate-dependent enzyme [Pedobacter sp. MR2016-19]MBE5321370.1 aminotransferase class III-fold pyridoxal phosphate-dependent enzyme [Pedobacter sp. MR2016-19]
MNEPKMQIIAAYGDFLVDASGQKYFDLCMGYGSVSLGHNFAGVMEEQVKQLQNYSSPGFVETEIFAQAKQVVENYMDGYYVYGFYNSGANAVEIAVKMALTSKMRPKIISFAKSMHGKTLFASQLGFDSYPGTPDQIIKIPFVGEKDESDILNICEEHMRSGNVAAVIIEPIQMSGGGFKASPLFYCRLEELAAHYGVIQIYDEILIGFYRTGTPFFHKTYGLKPDIVLTGKAMGNGFPVSAILLKDDFVILQQFRGGGTYFNHPLACSSIIATLNAFNQLDVALHIARIEDCILKHLPAHGLSGKGALWNIDMGSPDNMSAVVNELLANKIIVSFYDRYIRLFPNYQVDLEQLINACQIVKRYL